MQPRAPKTPDEIRAMPPGELLDYVKRPSKPTEDTLVPEARRCEKHGIYLWPEGVECPVCVHAERDDLRAMVARWVPVWPGDEMPPIGLLVRVVWSCRGKSDSKRARWNGRNWMPAKAAGIYECSPEYWLYEPPLPEPPPQR